MENIDIEYEQRVEHAMNLLSDIIPYHTEDYDSELRNAAEDYIAWEDAENVVEPQALTHAEIDKLFDNLPL